MAFRQPFSPEVSWRSPVFPKSWPRSESPPCPTCPPCSGPGSRWPLSRTGSGSFPPEVLFWAFLTQVLSANHACRAAQQNVLARLACHENRTASPNTSAYCQARRRLRCDWLADIHEGVVDRLEAAADHNRLWYGRAVKIVDGSGVSMPDTEENQAAFPRPNRPESECGFPVARLAVIFSLLTGAVLDLAWDSLHVAETTLSRRMWSRLEAGDVLLADRGFCSFADFWRLKQRGVDSVMRLNAKRSVGMRVVRVLGKNDRLVVWFKSKQIPIWMGLEEWTAMPRELLLREIHFTVDIPGFRTRAVTVVTTLLDARLYPAEAFGALYRRRWMAELSLRDLKTSMDMEILRCKSPEMIEREIRMFLIAYNLVRALILRAAQKYGADTSRMSFMGTLEKVLEWAPILAESRNKKILHRLTDVLLFQIAFDPVPHRPNRVEPRAVKRRPKNYARLNKPRREYKEIFHRNKYVKALT